MRERCISIRTTALLLAFAAYATDVWAANVNSCRTINTPGLHRLTRNIQAPAGVDCFRTAESFVTLDFNGYAIRGDGTRNGVDVDNAASGLKGITIRNGTITNFLGGISFGANDADGVVIERMRVVDNLGAGIFMASTFAIVSNNVVQGNDTLGISVGDGSIVTDNVVRDNGGHGISALSGCIVTGNNVADNDGFGISAGSVSTVSGNTVNANGTIGVGGDGISVICPASFTGNTSASNVGMNLVTSGVCSPDLDHNDIQP